MSRGEHFRVLFSTEWWKILKKDIEFNIKNIEERIYSEIDPESNSPKYSTMDLLRIQRSCYKWLLWIGEGEIASSEEIQTKDFDPYEKTPVE